MASKFMVEQDLTEGRLIALRMALVQMVQHTACCQKSTLQQTRAKVYF